MDREYALEQVRRYKHEIMSIVADAKVFLYGSYSRNAAHKDSDIDVAVIVPNLNGKWLELSSALWLATLKVNTDIEPVLMEEGNPSPLYDDIMHNGIAI